MTLGGADAVNWVRVLGILAAGVLVWLVLKFVLRGVRRALIHGEADEDSEKRALTLIRAIRYAAGTILVAIVLMLLLSEFGVSIAPLLGAAGVAGIAVGLAAQGVAKDLIGGVSLLADNHIRVGDSVEVAGKTGTVEAVTLRSVRLREYDGTVHFIHNGEINTVTNRSLDPVYAVLDLTVDASADVAAVRRVIVSTADLLRSDPQLGPLLKGQLDMAGLEQWEGDSSLIRARLPVTAGSQASVRREWLTRVKTELERLGISGPAQRVWLLGNAASRS